MTTFNGSKYKPSSAKTKELEVPLGLSLGSPRSWPPDKDSSVHSWLERWSRDSGIKRVTAGDNWGPVLLGSPGGWWRKGPWEWWGNGAEGLREMMDWPSFPLLSSAFQKSRILIWPPNRPFHSSYMDMIRNYKLSFWSSESLVLRKQYFPGHVQNKWSNPDKPLGHLAHRWLWWRWWGWGFALGDRKPISSELGMPWIHLPS